jgi:hypothetical protein
MPITRAGSIDHFFKKGLAISVLISVIITGHTLPVTAQQAERTPGIEVYVLGMGGAGIQDANVTLWQCAYDGRTGHYNNVKPVSSCKTLTISCGLPGTTPGLYNVTAEKGGNIGYSVVELTAGMGVRNVNVMIDEHEASMRAPPRYLRTGGLISPPMPPSIPGGPPSPVQLPPSAPSWLEPIPRTNYYGHSYNITSTYYVTQPDGTYLTVYDIKYNNSVKGIVTADGYFTIVKGSDGYWHYVDFYTGKYSGRAGLDKPASSDCCGVYEGPSTNRSMSFYLPYVPRPAYIGLATELSGISGMITDKSGSGVTGASVTVYSCAYDALTGKYLDLSMVLNPTNPQTSRDDVNSTAGIYAIPYLPPGTYRVTAEKDGHISSRVVEVDTKKGTSTADIVIDTAT